MIEIDTTLLSILFAFFGGFYSLLLVAVLRVRRRRRTPEGVSTGSRFSLMIPARDEAAVLARALEGILAMDYPSEKFEVLVIDDGSTDGTSEIAGRFASRHAGRVSIIQISQATSGRGKSEALNFGFRHLIRTSRFNGCREWIIGVFDADGVPDRDLLRKAAGQFEDPRVGAVQASVRITNRHASRLARMQDIEFSAFSRVTQMVRGELLDSASLGGNGQFVRARALYGATISRKPHRFWRPGALTEDLELSARLVLRSWRIKHLATSYVHQEGVETFAGLFRQRTRWAWGSLQVFVEYILKLKFVRARNVPLKKRLDLAMSLSLFLMSPLVMIVWLLTFLDLIRVIEAVNQLPFLATLAISFGFFPIVTWGMWDQKEYRNARLPLNLLLFTAYTYHWLPCLYVAALRVIGGDDPRWFKTRRIEETAGARRHHRVRDRVSSWATAPRVAGVLAFSILAAVAAYLRWARAGLLDSFEDGYQHWWIAGYMIQTGQYYDSFSAMTRGNWLPLYDFGVAGVLLATGLQRMDVLKGVSLVFSVATLGVVYLAARHHSRSAAWASAAFFAFSPAAIILGSVALPEAITGFVLIGAYYVLFHSSLRREWRYGLAAAGLLIAASLRYEAWLFVVLLMGFFLAKKPIHVSRGDLLSVASPALLVMGVWVLFTSRFGSLPEIVIAQTSVDVRYKASIGALPALPEQLIEFWFMYFASSFALLVVGTAYAVRTVRREFHAFAVLSFDAALVAWTILGFGNPSPRYLYVTLPGLTILAGMAVSSLAQWIRGGVADPSLTRVKRRVPAIAAGAFVFVIMSATLANGYVVAVPHEPPGLFITAMERAGLFLRERPLPEGKLLVTESPVAAYLSGYPPGRMVGSAFLSDNATEAQRYLEENAAFLVVVTVPWYKLRLLFPDLADGQNTPAFRLLYDASGPEYEIGAHRVLVYEVIPRASGVPR